jgi:hypothetical protein
MPFSIISNANENMKSCPNEKTRSQRMKTQQPDRDVDMCMFVLYINIKMVFKQRDKIIDASVHCDYVNLRVNVISVSQTIKLICK